MPKTTTVLLAIIAVGVLLIAGVVVMQEMDRRAVAEALAERQRDRESEALFRKACATFDYARRARESMCQVIDYVDQGMSFDEAEKRAYGEVMERFKLRQARGWEQ